MFVVLLLIEIRFLHNNIYVLESILQGLQCFADVIFCKGKIHALMYNGSLRVIDIQPDNPHVEDLAPPYPVLRGGSPPYIVESSNGLLMVERQNKISRSNDPIKEFVNKTLQYCI